MTLFVGQLARRRRRGISGLFVERSGCSFGGRGWGKSLAPPFHNALIEGVFLGVPNGVNYLHL